jgi:hypothetical protein
VREIAADSALRTFNLIFSTGNFLTAHPFHLRFKTAESVNHYQTIPTPKIHMICYNFKQQYNCKAQTETMAIFV